VVVQDGRLVEDTFWMWRPVCPPSWFRMGACLCFGRGDGTENWRRLFPDE
jgi:hypothetical protein